MSNPTKLVATLLPTVAAAANDDTARFPKETGGYAILFFLGLCVAGYAIHRLCRKCDENEAKLMGRNFRRAMETREQEYPMALINADTDTYGTAQDAPQPRSESPEP